jgi:hypothetical protein
MKKQILPQGLLLLCVLATLLCNAQITFNANTQQPPAYNGTFRIGMNMGQGYPSYATDEQLATLSYSVGARTVRPGCKNNLPISIGFDPILNDNALSGLWFQIEGKITFGEKLYLKP